MHVLSYRRSFLLSVYFSQVVLFFFRFLSSSSGFSVEQNLPAQGPALGPSGKRARHAVSRGIGCVAGADIQAHIMRIETPIVLDALCMALSRR
jgi:hypothetical protein